MAPRPLQLYRLHVTLRWSTPPIWRQLQVPGNRSLHMLHQVLQVAMGWEHSHLHEFIQGDRHYGEPDPELEFAGFKTTNSRQVSLERIAPTVGSTFTYLYDYVPL